MNRQVCKNLFEIPESPELPARRFRAIYGTYGQYWTQLHLDLHEDNHFYDYHEFRRILESPVNEVALAYWDRVREVDDPYWKLCSVTAPWLSKLGSDAEYGVFCDICEDIGPYHIEPCIPRSIREGKAINGADCWEVAYPYPARIPFMTAQELEEHQQTEHAGGGKAGS